MQKLSLPIMQLKKIPAFLFILYIVFFVFSCKKDDFSTDTSYTLAFSEDTIMFDTVFASVGSATEVFTVYNTNDEALKVSSIRLATGNSSPYRLNVDGMPGKEFHDVEIGAHDSIFIFVEVTVDPQNINTPYIVSDSILFETNGNLQDVDLVAFGQRAVYHHWRPDDSPLLTFPYFIVNQNGSESWSDSLPHVFYGYGIVDSATTLTINPGTHIYMHPGAVLFVYNTASLHIDGTPSQQVVIQGDRLSYDYHDVPGQWERIYFLPGSKNSTIRNAIIRNGNIGLQADTFASANDSTLYLENTIVENMVTHALLLEGAKVSAYNCVFSNCGSNVANIVYGGDYKFYHCTFANFWQNSTRQDPVLTMSNYYNGGPRMLNAWFGNSIIYGDNDQEFGIDSINLSNFYNFHFDHCLMKVEPSFGTSTPFHYSNILRANGSNNQPRFHDVTVNDYTLDTLSACVNSGDPAILNIFPGVLNNDILGNSRLIDIPDLGAYERQQ